MPSYEPSHNRLLPHEYNKEPSVEYGQSAQIQSYSQNNDYMDNLYRNDYKNDYRNDHKYEYKNNYKPDFR